TILLFIIGRKSNDMYIQLELGDFLSSLPQSVIRGDAVSLNDNVIRKIFNFAKLKKNDIYYHLGCGEGNTVAIAAKEFGIKKSVGIEIDKSLADKARKHIANIKNAYIINADIRKADISEGTVLLFWFGDLDMVETMTKRFKKELKDGARVITIWAPLSMTLPDKVEFPFFINKKPFKRARSIQQQIKAIYGTKCIDFTASWLLAERYIDALEVTPGKYRRFVNMLQSMIIWINAWNMQVACEDEIPPPVQTYIGILKTFFNIDLSSMITKEQI
ncbi:MAG TPA: rRNA adenine N-6-methyltransferase family protein, partial [Nitrososphaera sp.]|nr:rRNA adenine N-6-methyltransferase family protein [Nitrososphaera sp.]